VTYRHGGVACGGWHHLCLHHKFITALLVKGASGDGWEALGQSGAGSNTPTTPNSTWCRATVQAAP
jgi:hypothetical protein